MKRDDFKEKYLVDTKIKIANREQCYKFQEIAFEFGVRVHSQMFEAFQTPICYNIADQYPEYKGRSFATDMDNLCIYDNGTRLQQSAMYWLEDDKRAINFEDMISDYEKLEHPITA